MAYATIIGLAAMTDIIFDRVYLRQANFVSLVQLKVLAIHGKYLAKL